MSVDAKLTYNLSQQLNEPIDTIKLALERNNGNVKQAIQLLEKWAKIRNTHNSSKNTMHSIVSTLLDKDIGSASIFKISCDNEDFVRTKEFENLVEEIANDLVSYDQTITTEPAIQDIRKNKKCKFEEMHHTWKGKTSPLSMITTYNHCGKIAAMVETEVTSQEAYNNKLFKNFSLACAMHVIVYAPRTIEPGEIPAPIKEKLILAFENELLREGKDIKFWKTATTGKLEKWSEQNSMINQPFIMNEKQTVKQAMDATAKAINSEIKINKIIRYSVEQ